MSDQVENSTFKKEHQLFQVKRLLQIFWAIEFTLFLIFLQRILLGGLLDGLIVASVGVFLFIVRWLAKKEKIAHAATIMLFVLTLMITYFMWANGGVFDEVVLAYPGVLIITAMLGRVKLFIYLFILIITSISLNGTLNTMGLYTNASSTIGMDTPVLIILIFTLISYTIWVMAADFRKLFERLQQENTEVKSAKVEIETMLRRDILTHLPNRLMAEEYFHNSYFESNDVDSTLHLFFIDLDNFKLINDAFGHQAGDLLLIEISNRLSKVVASKDLVCRFAGDEFIIIFDTLKNDEQVASIAEEIISTVIKPFYYKGNEFICGCSIGVVVAPTNGDEFDMLLRNADTAMYYAKSMGGNCFHFFNEEMNTQGHEYLKLIAELRQAIKAEEFFLVYQPKINLKTNKVIGAEALIRWEHPQKGIIYPDSFIAQAEKSGLIVEIGEWVIKEACQICKKWVDKGYEDFSIAVNVSSQQFARGDIFELVKTSLDYAKLDGKNLELEMTESLLIDNSQDLKNTFKAIQDLGVSFSVDDFGTGYSNLGYLKEFEISSLKIDKSFIFDVEHNVKNSVLVKAIVQMADGLGLQTVAEGIENIETANKLVEFRCDLAQGYFWSKPVSESAFLQYSEKVNNH